MKLLRTLRLGALYGASGAAGLWAADAVQLLPSHLAMGWRRYLAGIASSAFVSLTAGALFGAASAPVLAPAIRGLTPAARTWRHALLSRRPANVRAVSARITAGLALLLLMLLLEDRAALEAPLLFARAESVALAIAAAQVGFASLAVVSWFPTLRATRTLLRALERVRPFRFISRRGWFVPVLALVPLLLAPVLVLRRLSLDVTALPWRDLAPVPGMFSGCFAAWAIIHSPAASVRRAALGVLLALTLVAGVVAFRLRPEATASRALAFRRSLPGRIGYATWTLAFDFDRDGQLGILGGGDCAPFDPRRYTGAVEVPGNGVDEDCDGSDLTPLALQARGRSQVGQEALPHRPTLVLITVDGLAATKLTALGATREIMPNVDAFAREAVLFTQAYSEGPSTRLSFPSMFTSRYDSQLVQQYAPTHPYPLAPSERQIQDALDDAGYETIAVLPSAYFEPRRWASMTRDFQRIDTSAVAAGKHNAKAVTDAALRALEGAGERPRFLWVHYYDAHGPYLPIPGVAYPVDSEEARYDAELTLIDHEVARLLSSLRAKRDSTYVFFTADHGSTFDRRPGRQAHYGADLYSETIHVPLLVWGAGLAPRRVDGLASTMDIVPTITDLLRLPDKSDALGASLWPELLLGRSERSRTLFHEIYLGERDYRGKDPLVMVSVRDSSWDLILDRDSGQYELYDYKNDPHEEKDLFEESSVSPRAQHLRSLLGLFVEQFHRRAVGTAVLTADERNP